MRELQAAAPPHRRTEAPETGMYSMLLPLDTARRNAYGPNVTSDVSSVYDRMSSLLVFLRALFGRF